MTGVVFAELGVCREFGVFGRRGVPGDVFGGARSSGTALKGDSKAANKADWRGV